MLEDLQRIHNASMRILDEVGVRFHHPDILVLLDKEGIKTSGQTAFFTEDQIMRWVKKAPSQFTLHAINPKYNMQIGGGSVQYAPGYGAPAIVESDGARRNAVVDDYLNFLKLFHQSDHFKINGGILVDPTDLLPDFKYPVLLYYTLTHSDKCVIGMQCAADQAQITMDMMAIVAGGKENLLAQPRIITIVNTLSPLQFDRNSLDTMLAYAAHGQPVMITPAAMAGATAPATLAGTIAQSNAETLAGIAVFQMIREGNPVLYGYQSTAADMRTGGHIVGCPEHALCVQCGARLAKFYGLPCRGGGTPNDAKRVSVQSGYESMMVMMVTCQEKTDLILHSAGMMDSHAAMSYEQFIVDLEIIGMINRLREGVHIDEDALALDVIKEVGPGGQFLTNPHTFEHCRNEFWIPEVSLRGALSGRNPDEVLMEKIEKKKQKLLAEYQKPEIPENLVASMLSYLTERGVDTRLLS